MAKISVIIPVYNGEKYLSECLDSLVNQTFKDIEIICVNDCSKDSSLEILNSYAQKDNRIKIINQETNQGQSIGRNIGIQASQGEYIMFIDQDDWYELNTCEEVYNQIKANDNDLLLFNIKYNAYVVVELKVSEFKVEYISQVQKYMNYIDKNIKEVSNNCTIGILICKRENKFVIEYCSDDRIAVREYELV